MKDEMRKLIEKAAVALKEAGAHEVYLFGSQARGNIHEESDIDLAVSGLPPEKYFRFFQLLCDCFSPPKSNPTLFPP